MTKYQKKFVKSFDFTVPTRYLRGSGEFLLSPLFIADNDGGIYRLEQASDINEGDLLVRKFDRRVYRVKKVIVEDIEIRSLFSRRRKRVFKVWFDNVIGSDEPFELDFYPVKAVKVGVLKTSDQQH